MPLDEAGEAGRRLACGSGSSRNKTLEKHATDRFRALRLPRIQSEGAGCAHQHDAHPRAAGSLSMWFEDIVLGEKRELGGYTFTEAAIIAFAKKYDPQSFHV